MGSAAATAWSMPAGSGARLRASTAVYSASEPFLVQSARPNTRCPTLRPVVPYPSSATTPDSSCPGTLGRPVAAGPIGPRRRAIPARRG